MIFKDNISRKNDFMDFREHQKFTYKKGTNYLAIYVANHFNIKTAIDLGCGSGNTTVYLAKKGIQVLAVYNQLKVSYILSRLNQNQSKLVSFEEKKFEEIKLPKTDFILSTFSLPFCEEKKFLKVWEKIVNALSSKGVFAGNFFGPRNGLKNTIQLNEQEVRNLFQAFEIIKWKEVEMDRSDNTHWHYFDIIALKK